MDQKIKAGIIGATGYAGQELARLLYTHPQAEVIWYGSRSYVDQPYSKVYGNMKAFADQPCRDDDIAALAEEADVIFTATPQGYLAGVLTEDILSKCKVIDLSADFRLKDVSVYEKWYKLEHKSPQFLEEAVYGLCEVNREQIRGTRLLANPGCFTTCSIESLYPLVKEHAIDPEEFFSPLTAQPFQLRAVRQLFSIDTVFYSEPQKRRCFVQRRSLSETLEKIRDAFPVQPLRRQSDHHIHILIHIGVGMKGEKRAVPGIIPGCVPDQIHRPSGAACIVLFDHGMFTQKRSSSFTQIHLSRSDPSGCGHG